MKIEVSALQKSYFLREQQVPVLLGINLEIFSGEFVSLTGSSGVGKSTLLHILGTLDTPTSGQVRLGGVNVFEKKAADIAQFRNRNIGFVFQFHHLLPEFSALENVKIPLLIRREKEDSAHKKAQEMLDLVGLSHRFSHKPGELSGGEQQRVALARALVTSPQLLLADEPTGNLDEETGARIIELMQKINQQEKVTVIVVTHNLRLAKQAQKQLVLTRDGIR